MIIPRHRICNFCGEEVGINKRYFIIKSKDIIAVVPSCYSDWSPAGSSSSSCSAGIMSDNHKYDICEDCMREFAKYLHSKLRGEKE